MPETLKSCPVPWCEESQPWAKSTLPMNGGWKFIVTCGGCGLTTNYFETETEAIAAWNTRPESELERLAREVATVYRGWQATGKQQTHTIFDVLDSCSNLAAHFAEQDKGKTE